MASAKFAVVEADQVMWRALSDPTRRAILDLLRDAPATTGNIAEAFPISRVAVMKHLDTLGDAGLVTSRKRGRERWHYVNLAPVMALHERWSTPLTLGAATALQRLRGRVEYSNLEEDPVITDVSIIDIAMELDIAASPEIVFAALTTEPESWWGPPYVRPDAVALELTPEIGGALIERWEGGALLLATVTGLADGAWLQLTGAFHLGAATVVADIEVTPLDTGSCVGLSFRGSGLIAPEMLESFGGAWRELTARLKTYVETGVRTGLASDG